MKVVFLSNVFIHHQKPFSDNMYELTGGQYYFIATESLSQERKQFGYQELSAPYLINYNEQTKDFVKKIIDDADAVIFGSADYDIIADRINKGKLVFRYSERLMKNWGKILKYPVRYYKLHKVNPNNKNMYLLCASAYTSHDYNYFGLYKNKAYKWGYFTALDDKNADELINTKTPSSIIWAARFLDWKHPETPLEIARRLKLNGYDFQMEIIGAGVLEQKIKNTIDKYGLSENVKLLGAMPTDRVREHMEKSEIFLFSSDFHEGWGAVLNEAMSSACAVVSSHAIGSTKYLIDDGKNGFIYKNGNLDDLYKKVEFLLKNPIKRKELSVAAYKTVSEKWNPKVAAERFIKFTEGIINGKDVSEMFEDGPCSVAEIVKNNWYKG